MWRLRMIVPLAALVIVAGVLVPGLGVRTREPVAQEEPPRFARVARKVFTPKCALHY